MPALVATATAAYPQPNRVRTIYSPPPRPSIFSALASAARLYNYPNSAAFRLFPPHVLAQKLDETRHLPSARNVSISRLSGPVISRAPRSYETNDHAHSSSTNTRLRKPIKNNR